MLAILGALADILLPVALINAERANAALSAFLETKNCHVGFVGNKGGWKSDLDGAQKRIL